MPAPKPLNRNEAALRETALAYPETHEDFPWGHRAIKVRGKAFVFMSNDEVGLSLSVKLPASAEGALQFPFCEPTHYGLGKSGWVTATFGPKDRPPLDVLRSWIDESYRAVAPKKLVAMLAARAPASAATAPKKLVATLAARDTTAAAPGKTPRAKAPRPGRTRTTARSSSRK
jgi:predicted DNA-binding protein (MmcQ/YjbR family)